MGFDRTDLLKQAGYSDTDHIEVSRARTVTQTSTTSVDFTPAGSNGTQRQRGLVIDLETYPDDTTLQVRYKGEISTSNTEVAIYQTNPFGGIQTTLTATTTSVSSSNTLVTGPREEISTTGAAPDRFGVAIRSTDGNQAFIRNGSISAEVRL